MGLFSNHKKVCPICGNPTPRLLPTKIEDMPICKDCDRKIDLPKGLVDKMTLDKFEKVYMEYLNNARQKQDFTDFVNKVRNANEGFNGEITGPLITDMSKLVVYNIDCKLTYKNNRDRVVIGIIMSIDKQNEVSYYATQEG